MEENAPLTPEEVSLLEGAARQQFLNYALLYLLEKLGPQDIPFDNLASTRFAGVSVTHQTDTHSTLSCVTHEQFKAQTESNNHTKQ